MKFIIRENIKEKIIKSICVIFISSLIILLFYKAYDTRMRYQTRDIKGIMVQQEEEENYNGFFVIAVGKFNKKDSINTNYYLYIKGKEGYKLQSIDAFDVEIVETDEVKPCIKGYFEKDSADILPSEDYIIYVPENTITIDYSIDLEKELNKR